MTDLKIPLSISKGKWKEITSGKIPVKTSFVQKPKIGKRKGQTINTTRTQMVLPGNALSGDYEVDFERLEEEGISIPDPDSMTRLHVHEGAEEPHKVGIKHNDLEVRAEHEDEKEKYNRNFYKLTQKQESWENDKRTDTKELRLRQQKLKRKPVKTSRDKLKIDQLEEQIKNHEEAITAIVSHESPDWMEKYLVEIHPGSIAYFKGKPIETDLYRIKNAPGYIRTFESQMGDKFYLFLKGPTKELCKKEVYHRSNNIAKRLEELFSDQSIRLKYGLSTKAIEKERIEYNKQRKEELSGDLQSILDRTNKLKQNLSDKKQTKIDNEIKRQKDVAERKVTRAKENVQREKDKKTRIIQRRKAKRDKKVTDAEKAKLREEKKIARETANAKKESKKKRALTKRRKTMHEMQLKLDEKTSIKEKKAKQREKDERKKLKVRSQKRLERENRKAAQEAEKAKNAKRKKKKVVKPSKNETTRKSIISKMDVLIKEWDDDKERVENTGNFNVVSDFHSGDNKVTLEGKDDQYKVATNGVPSLTTDSFREALGKYYSSVSRVIESNTDNKDLALELFGEHVLNTSRNTRKLMSDLDKQSEVKMLESLDYTKLSIPFNPDFITKADPTGDFFEIVPPVHDSTEVESANDTGTKIGRKDLDENDYEHSEIDDEEQNPIEEESSEPGIAATGANIITNALNQFQILPTRQEENVHPIPVEHTRKVKNVYSQDIHPPEEKVIEGNNGVY